MYPVLFPFLLRLWQYFGNGEFILRLLPFTFGILSIFATYKIGQLLFNTKTGLIAAFIISISPLHIYYSQELTLYTLFTFLSLMSIFYLVKSLRNNKFLYWVSYIIFTTFSLQTHNMAIFLLITENIFFILFYKRYRTLLKKYLISQLFIILLYLPYFKIIFEQLVNFRISDLFYYQPHQINLFNFVNTFVVFNLGYNAPKAIQFLSILIFTPLFFLGIIGNNKKEEIWLLLYWLFIPLIITFILTVLITHVYFFRALIYISVAYYILIAYGISNLKPRNVYLFILLGYAILIAPGLKNYYQNIFPFATKSFYPCYGPGINPREETIAAVSYIEKKSQKGDIIGHTQPSTYLPFLYYHKDKSKQKILTLGFLRNFYFVNQKSFRLIGMMPVDIRVNTKIKNNRVWLVLSSWEDDEKERLSKYVKEYLDKNYVMAEYKEFVGITVYLYRIK
jgi:hypothetical protein